MTHVLFWWRDLRWPICAWTSGWPFWMRGGTLALGLIWQYSLTDTQNGQDLLQYFFWHPRSWRSCGHFPLRRFALLVSHRPYFDEGSSNFGLCCGLFSSEYFWLFLMCHKPFACWCKVGWRSRLVWGIAAWPSTEYGTIAKTFYLATLQTTCLAQVFVCYHRGLHRLAHCYHQDCSKLLIIYFIYGVCAPVNKIQKLL